MSFFTCEKPLLAHTGSKPDPTDRSRYSTTRADHWWKIVVPNTDEEKEWSSSLTGWSHFDTRKLELSLRCVLHAATFLRARTQSFVDQGLAGSRTQHATTGSALSGAKTLAIDFDVVADVFCKCAFIFHEKTSGKGGGGGWSPACSSLLLQISNNLICAIHDLVICSASELSAWDAKLNSCFTEADRIAVLHASQPHQARSSPFLVKVARKIRDRIASHVTF